MNGILIIDAFIAPFICRFYNEEIDARYEEKEVDSMRIQGVQV